MIKLTDSTRLVITDTLTHKILKSPTYNFYFEKMTGLFVREGEAEFSPFGPEIVDIEVSTVCHCKCPFCYKGNNPDGQNMPFRDFKTLFDKLPKTVTQIALGIGDIDGNPDLWEIMGYIRSNGVVPNITINGYRMAGKNYDRLVKYCGAVAVSNYEQDICWEAVTNLVVRGLKQVNIHCLLSDENSAQCVLTLMNGINRHFNGAVVFLTPKSNTLHQVSQDRYDWIMNLVLNNSIPIGFDSCGSPRFVDYLKRAGQYSDEMGMLIEPCESSLFSYYINVEGKGYPCSFAERRWPPVDVLGADTFSQVWNDGITQKFRRDCLASDVNGCRKCILYLSGVE